MTIDTKAVRLLAEGRVAPEPAPVQAFTVEGEHGVYRVVVGASLQMCSCPAVGRCSHIEAAVQRVLADEDALALMDAALEQRREHKRRESDEIFSRL